MWSFNRYLSGLPLSRKLLGLMVGVVLAIALLASSVLMVSAYLISREYFVPANVQAVVKILSEDSVLMTLTGNVTRAEQTLEAATEYTQIRALAIYTPDGKLHASFNRAPDQFDIPVQAPAAVTTENQYLARAEQVPGEEYTLFIQADPALPDIFYSLMTVAGLIILACFFLLTFYATQYLRRFINVPVLHLIRVANKISLEENYSVRARTFHDDEIGKLAKAFNTMLERIAARDQQLTEERDKAEKAGEHARLMAAEMQSSNASLAHEVQVRTRVENKLTRFQNYLSNIIDSMPSALLAVNEQKIINQCNTEAAKLAGNRQQQIIGKPLDSALPFLHQCQEAVDKVLQQQKPERVEKLPLKIAGEENYLDMVIYPLSGDETPGAVIRIDNITRRLRIEEIMVQTEKMMSVGGLAAGMAHEINNPLGAVLQGTQNIRRRISRDLPANRDSAEQHHLDMSELNAYLEERGIHRFLDNIQDAGLRASKIVANMLQFSRNGSKTLTPTNLTDLIERTIDIASSDFNLQKGFDFMHIRVHRELAQNLPDVPCIASEIQQVLLNLLKNAAHAINNRKDKTELGTITVSTCRQDNQAVITVADNGSGMDEEVRKRVFEPFYTTKDVGQGTGLGLSVSYFIISDNHKGAMSVFSIPGRGSKFTVQLPLETSLLGA
ncbi:MAG: ATP-binding protein [Endozoicomonas sp.]